MKPVNIEVHERGVNADSNVRLHGKDGCPLHVKTKSYYYWIPDGDGYAPAEESYRWNVAENPLSTAVGLRGSRKQRAAKALRPVESIKIVQVPKQPVHPLEAIAIYSGGSDADVAVARKKGELCRILDSIIEGQ